MQRVTDRLVSARTRGSGGDGVDSKIEGAGTAGRAGLVCTSVGTARPFGADVPVAAQVSDTPAQTLCIVRWAALGRPAEDRRLVGRELPLSVAKRLRSGGDRSF